MIPKKKGGVYQLEYEEIAKQLLLKADDIFHIALKKQDNQQDRDAIKNDLYQKTLEIQDLAEQISLSVQGNYEQSFYDSNIPDILDIDQYDVVLETKLLYYIHDKNGDNVIYVAVKDIAEQKWTSESLYDMYQKIYNKGKGDQFMKSDGFNNQIIPVKDGSRFEVPIKGIIKLESAQFYLYFQCQTESDPCLFIVSKPMTRFSSNGIYKQFESDSVMEQICGLYGNIKIAISGTRDILKLLDMQEDQYDEYQEKNQSIYDCIKDVGSVPKSPLIVILHQDGKWKLKLLGIEDIYTSPERFDYDALLFSETLQGRCAPHSINNYLLPGIFQIDNMISTSKNTYIIKETIDLMLFLTGIPIQPNQNDVNLYIKMINPEMKILNKYYWTGEETDWNLLQNASIQNYQLNSSTAHYIMREKGNNVIINKLIAFYRRLMIYYPDVLIYKDCIQRLALNRGFNSDTYVNLLKRIYTQKIVAQQWTQMFGISYILLIDVLIEADINEMMQRIYQINLSIYSKIKQFREIYYIQHLYNVFQNKYLSGSQYVDINQMLFLIQAYYMYINGGNDLYSILSDDIWYLENNFKRYTDSQLVLTDQI